MNKIASRECMKKYKTRWIKSRRDQWINENGPCKQCGALERLEVDHVDPKEKKYRVGSLWSRKAEIREEELKKCQVLCEWCHKQKTASELRKKWKGNPNFKVRKINDNLIMKALRLYYDEGLSRRKVSAMLGLSQGTLSAAIYSSTRSVKRPVE